MFPIKLSSSIFNKRAFTLLEMLFSTFLLSMLGLIMTYGMIAHARVSKSNYTNQKLADQANRFINSVQTAAIDADNGGFSIHANSAGTAGTVLTITKTNEAGAIANLKQYAYIDRDNNPNTIGDNVVVERDVNQATSNDGQVVLQYCSPINATTPIFSIVQGTAIPTLRVAIRTGDRTNPPSAADNTETGRGYQSFVLDSYIASLSVMQN